MKNQLNKLRNITKFSKFSRQEMDIPPSYILRVLVLSYVYVENLMPLNAFDLGKDLNDLLNQTVIYKNQNKIAGRGEKGVKF